jgi:hypothetical protein
MSACSHGTAEAATSSGAEEIMRYFGKLGALSVLCLLGTQHGHAQNAACGGGEACAGKTASAQIERSVAAAATVRAEDCPSLPVEVVAGSADERRLACSSAADALGLLAACGIAPKRPLRVYILGEVRHPFSGAIFGMFDGARERVLVTQEANIPRLVEDTPYAGLPLRDFYKSLIVHEIVHGVMHQNLKRKGTSHAAYEYPAYVLQIESLPPRVREAFLSAFDQRALGSDTLFNDSVLLFDPFFFAAHAYHHFKSAPNGCAHLTGLLNGEVSFIAPAK